MYAKAKLPPADLAFDTLTALVDYAEALPDAGYADTHRNDWAGGSFTDAVRLARHGWPDGAAKAARLSTRIADRVVAATGANAAPEIGYDVVGAAFDVGALAQGIPEAWGVSRPAEAKRAVHLAINIIASCGVSPRTLETRGLAVAALALALQARGHPVTVDVLQRTQIAYGGGIEQISVRVADASTGSQLDLDRIVFAMAHPSMLRRLLKAVTDGRKRQGSGSRWDPSHPVEAAAPGSTYDLYIGGVHYDSRERWADGGEAWVLAEYERQTSR